MSDLKGEAPFITDARYDALPAGAVIDIHPNRGGSFDAHRSARTGQDILLSRVLFIMKREPRYFFGLFAGILLLTSQFACMGPAKTAPVREATGAGPLGSSFVLPPNQPTRSDLDALLLRLEREPDNAQPRRELGILYQTLSPPDHWDFLDRAIENLELAREQVPDDPATLMFLGLAKAAKGRDPAVNLLAKLATARAGFRLMDQALALAPDNFSLRLLRGKAQLLAPGILGRKQALSEDHGWLRVRLQAHPAASLPHHLAARGHLFLGDYQHRIEKDEEGARELWRRARELGKGSFAAVEATSRLAGSPEGF